MAHTLLHSHPMRPNFVLSVPWGLSLCLCLCLLLLLLLVVGAAAPAVLTAN